MVLRRVRKGLQRFWLIVDSEGVGIFQAVVYVHIVLGGLYGVAIAAGTPPVVEETMGHTVALAWLWLCMGAGVCLAGKSLTKKFPREAIYMQLIGDIFVFGSLLAYVTATVTQAYWGKELFAVFIVESIAECVVLLIIRDVRRIIEVERVYKR